MRPKPNLIDWKVIPILPDGWSVASTVNFDAVMGRFLIVGIAGGGLVYMWHIGRNLPKNTDLERGMAYMVMLGGCGFVAAALHFMVRLDSTWSWVAFLAATVVSWAGMASGYKAIDDENKVTNPGARKPSTFQNMALFLIAAAVGLLIFKGYFLILWMLCR